MRRVEKTKTVLKTPPFDVQEIHFRKDPEDDNPYYRLHSKDWVNILPITKDGQAVLIRQERIGTMSQILETPGGVVDPGEERDPTQTAMRELEEETGYTTSRIIYLGSMSPNPAILTNRIHYFFAPHCFLPQERKHFPDPQEKIEVVLAKAQDLEEMVRIGKIDHSLSALCIFLAGKYIKIRP